MTQWIRENNWLLSLIVGALIGAGGIAWTYQETLTRHDERIEQNRQDIAAMIEIRRDMQCLKEKVSVIASYIQDLKRREHRK
jgi:hypothetical protein